jgi:integrase
MAKMADANHASTPANPLSMKAASVSSSHKCVCTTFSPVFGKLVLPERCVPEETPSLAKEQARAIIAEAKGQFRAMSALAAVTGLRAGEILALQIRDFDFQNRLLSVRRSETP